ncbi:MAG TPA: hypothetical protein VHC43_08200 [Mycobacteriales bacterium]|nr:hypothetical protein [Mycobacteriales bacterium]
MLNPRRDQDLLNFSLSNGGVVDHRACERAGITADKLRWLIDSGRWQPLFPRTFATFSGPIPYEVRLEAALLYAGAGSVLSHETAGAEHAICGRPDSIHVTVPYHREVVDQPGLVIHRSRTLRHSDIVVPRPRRTTVERTVLDLLADKPSAQSALGLVGDAIRTRTTSADRLRAALQQAPRTRWRRVVLDALPDVAAGAQSPLELRDAQLRRRHGLPAGRRQARRTGEGAEYLDVLIEPYGVHIELDGRLGHDRATERWRDMRRDNRSELAGLRHLRYGWADVVDRPCQVAIEQATVLRQQGWRGAFKRCTDCPDALPPAL